MLLEKGMCAVETDKINLTCSVRSILVKRWWCTSRAAAVWSSHSPAANNAIHTFCVGGHAFPSMRGTDRSRCTHVIAAPATAVSAQHHCQCQSTSDRAIRTLADKTKTEDDHLPLINRGKRRAPLMAIDLLADCLLRHTMGRDSENYTDCVCLLTSDDLVHFRSGSTNLSFFR